MTAPYPIDETHVPPSPALTRTATSRAMADLRARAAEVEVLLEAELVAAQRDLDTLRADNERLRDALKQERHAKETLRARLADTEAALAKYQGTQQVVDTEAPR